MKFYTLKHILAKNCPYNMIIGERSNGKTYACLEKALTDFVKNGKQFAYLRRWQEDLRPAKANTIFNSIIENGLVSKLTGGEWTDVTYYSGKWYLCRYDDEGKRELLENPIGYFFALSSMEHDKSTSYPCITNIIFDEFITRSMYLPDEFVIFCNVLSTIIRHRTDVTIFMLGNTVNKYCPYFNEMGLKHVKDMQQGTIDVYRYGDTNLTVAVEYIKPNRTGKPSDFYFAFDNPKLTMITGGTWEIDIYPHCPQKYKPKDIVFTYYIMFDGDILQCEIVNINDLMFTFIHAKTTPIKDPDNDIIYSCDYDVRPNYRRNLCYDKTRLGKKLLWFFQNDKVFYSTNEIGEIVRNYIIWCTKNDRV